MAAVLHLLPPLPPLPEQGGEVARGQRAFEFLDVVVFARGDNPPRRHPRPRQSSKMSGRWQYVIPFEAREERHRPQRKLRLLERERREMERDVRALTRAGVYKQRPRHGNGISGDCPEGPCGWVSCRHNLLVKIRPSGSAAPTWPNLDPDQAPATCSLREAAKQAPKDEPRPFSEIGAMMNLTAAAVHLTNAVAMRKFVERWIEMFPDDPPPDFRKG